MRLPSAVVDIPGLCGPERERGRSSKENEIKKKRVARDNGVTPNV
jgi:hypothetical protein